MICLATEMNLFQQLFCVDHISLESLVVSTGFSCVPKGFNSSRVFCVTKLPIS